jgi:hypothetical protein
MVLGSNLSPFITKRLKTRSLLLVFRSQNLGGGVKTPKISSAGQHLPGRMLSCLVGFKPGGAFFHKCQIG